MPLKPALSFFVPQPESGSEVPFYEGGIKAGFPSPAADFEGQKISLDRLLIKHQDTTFYARADGNSMIEAGIDDGDILVIDRKLEPQHQKIAVCCIDGEFTVKRISIQGTVVQLLPENPNYAPITITPENELIIWGIVTHVIKAV